MKKPILSIILAAICSFSAQSAETPLDGRLAAILGQSYPDNGAEIPEHYDEVYANLEQLALKQIFTSFRL